MLKIDGNRAFPHEGDPKINEQSVDKKMPEDYKNSTRNDSVVELQSTKNSCASVFSEASQSQGFPAASDSTISHKRTPNLESPTSFIRDNGQSVTSRHRSKQIDLSANHRLPPALSNIDPLVFKKCREEATIATSSDDLVAGMKKLLEVKTPSIAKDALDRELDDFKKRQLAIESALKKLTPQQSATYQNRLKSKCLDSLYEMSDTCSGASSGTRRGKLAKQYYKESFEAITDPNWRNKCLKNSRNGGIRHPLYGGLGTRFMEINSMLVRGGDKLGPAYEPGVFGRPRELGEEARVRHFVKSTPEDVDGSISTVPGGNSVKKNVKNISLFVEEYLNNPTQTTNPIEVLAKQYQCEVSNHACSNGNGRAALLNLMATAQDIRLPMPLMTKEGTKVLHAMRDQVAPEDNMAPLDAMAAVSQGIDRMLTTQERLIAEAFSQ